MNKNTIKEYKKCVASIMVEKYNISEFEAMKAIRDSYFEQSLKISKENTLHTDPEEWADDIYDYIYNEPELMEM